VPSAILAVKILADAKQAQKGMADAERSTAKWSAGLKKAALGAAVGIAAVGAGALSAAKAAAEDAHSQAMLRKALRNTTRATDKQVAATENWITNIELATGVTDDELRPALATLVRSTKNVTKAQSAMGLALNISAGTGKDVGSVAAALAKAYGGNVTALGKLVPGLDKAVLKSKDMGKITDELTRLFKGSAATAATTAEGNWKRLTVALQETKESIGAALLPVLTTLASWLVSTGIPAIKNFWSWIETKLVPSLAGWAAKIRDTVMPVLLALWEWVRTKLVPAAQSLWSWIQTKLVPALQNLWTWIQTKVIPVMQALWAWITTKLVPALRGVLTPAILGVVDAWQRARDAVQKVWDSLQKLGIKQKDIELILKAFMLVIGTNLVAAIYLAVGALEIISGTFQIIAGQISTVIDWIQKLIGWFKKIPHIGDIFHPGNPFAGGRSTPAVAGLSATRFAGVAHAPATRRSSGGAPIIINVNSTLASPAETGRAVVGSIRAYERAAGRGWRS
jgi:hypothetical protein